MAVSTSNCMALFRCLVPFLFRWTQLHLFLRQKIPIKYHYAASFVVFAVGMRGLGKRSHSGVGSSLVPKGCIWRKFMTHEQKHPITAKSVATGSGQVAANEILNKKVSMDIYLLSFEDAKTFAMNGLIAGAVNDPDTRREYILSI